MKQMYYDVGYYVDLKVESFVFDLSFNFKHKIEKEWNYNSIELMSRFLSDIL